MRFTTAIEFIKNGYFVADEAMTKMGAAIGLIDFPELDTPILVMKDSEGMEPFTLEPNIIFDNDTVWCVAVEDEDEEGFAYYGMDDSDWELNLEEFEDSLKECDWNDGCGHKCNCTAKEEKEKKELEKDPAERLTELQKEFLTKTMQLVYELDMTKKLEIYNELADISTEIEGLKKVVR